MIGSKWIAPTVIAFRWAARRWFKREEWRKLPMKRVTDDDWRAALLKLEDAERAYRRKP